MPTKLKVLILEDRAADAELTLYELRRAGYEPDWKRVETETDFLAQLDQGWDIILVDYNLPQFDGLRALRIARERGLSIPLIIVSGTIGEEKAVAAMKAGADDYVMKDRLAHLGPAVERELRSAVERRERKRAEEALRESESRYRVVFEGTKQGILVADAQTQRFLYANQSISRMLGYTTEELLRLGLADIHPQESLRRVKSDFKAQIRQEKTLAAGLPCLRKDGTIFHADINSSPILLDGRQCNVAFFTDITERMRAEGALKESEEKYRTLVENAAEAILIAQDGMLKFVNRTASEITGYSNQELRSSPFLEFVYPDDRRMVGERYMQRLTGDVSQPRYEFRLIDKEGNIKWLEIDAVLVVWEGKPATLNFLSDISERKRAAEALRQAEDNFRRSLDESPLGIRVVSTEGETLYANRAILDMYGYNDVEELKSTPVEKRYTPESYAEFRLRRKKRANGEDSSEYEIGIVRKTGEIRRLRVLRKEILWDGRKQFQAIYQDITERKKVEEKLVETLGSLRSALGGIFQVLSATTEKRDPYTAGHQRRVADLARAIGQEMGLATDRVEGLRIAGTIHDIGKVSIPAEILSKPSRLTEIEFKLIQSHSQVGHDILSDINFAWPLAEMVLQHHERMNGSGYPQRLKGEDILLEARILAVSDVVEAMASHRPYRPALGIEVALEEIEKNRGVLYDPEVVAACLALFREKGFNLK